MRPTLSALCGVLLCAPALVGQEPPIDRIRVDLTTCGFCDFDHVRRELTWVDYVRDQADADVQLLGTSQATGGGREYTFHFIGLGPLEGQETILYYRSSQTNTADETRNGQTRILAIGLLHYAALADALEGVPVQFDAPGGPTERPTAQTADPWNFWVFSVRAGGRVDGETREKGFSVNGRISADRVTENWKFEFDASARYSRDETELSDTTFVNESRNWDFEGLIVRSITNHWSAGVQWETAASTFSNQDFRASGAAALEYSVFDYAESTRRQLAFLYSVGVVYYDWEQVTIFDQLEEVRLEQTLLVSYRMVQPWGSANVFGNAHSFFHDLDLHRLSIGGGLNVRVARGFSIGMNGSVARIKDQISLRRGGISDEDILVRRRQIGTDYRYRLGFNMTYRFGSIFNNVVNPRIDF